MAVSPGFCLPFPSLEAIEEELTFVLEIQYTYNNSEGEREEEEAC